MKISANITFKQLLIAMLITFLLSTGVNTYITYQINEPLPEFDIELIQKHDVRVELKILFFNGTISWIPLIETDFFNIDNRTEQLIHQEYTYESGKYNLTGATFNFIWFYFHVPTQIHNRFLQITGEWIVEDKKGTLTKSSKDFKQSEEIAGFYTASVDITKYMFRDNPPEKVFGWVQLLNRS